MDGSALAEEIRSLRPETKILYMTGCSGMFIRADMLSPSVSLIRKPFTPADLACIIHQRWKGRRTVVGIEDERQELRQIWDRARAREVGSDWEGISRQSSACHNQERVSSKQDELLSWCR
jgi:CheY-like chemotaxis protein